MFQSYQFHRWNINDIIYKCHVFRLFCSCKVDHNLTLVICCKEKSFKLDRLFFLPCPFIVQAAMSTEYYWVQVRWSTLKQFHIVNAHVKLTLWMSRALMISGQHMKDENHVPRFTCNVEVRQDVCPSCLTAC